MQQLALAGGFADPVLDAQANFRAAMSALASPGQVMKLGATAAPPAPLTAELGTLALTLCDHETPLWLDAALRQAEAPAEWLRFHSGAPLTAMPQSAAFALATGARALPALAAFAEGSDEYPDRSTTLIIAVEAFVGGSALLLTGPGVETFSRIAPAGLPEDFVGQWQDNRQRFPRGIDLLLVAEGAVIGLPRSVRIKAEGN